MIRRMMLAGFIALAAIWPAAGDEREATALSASQQAVGRQLPDLHFLDVDGKPVSLDTFRGRPVLLTLVYTGCADICPLVIENLAPAVADAERALGAGSFSVLTIGFDFRHDTPARMRSFALQHNASAGNWHFLAAPDSKTLDRLSETVGFMFFPRAGGFDHMAQVTVIDKDGVIYRQIYGSAFTPPQVIEPLKELVLGRQRPLLSWAGLSERVRLFCTVYDPNTGRYYFNYSLFVSIAIGAGCLSLLAYALVRETLKSMKSGRV